MSVTITSLESTQEARVVLSRRIKIIDPTKSMDRLHQNMDHIYISPISVPFIDHVQRPAFLPPHINKDCWYA